LPLTASEVEAHHPFSDDELLYRRIGPDDFNSKGELKPTRINFTRDVQEAPSVMRSEFCTPEDVLHISCAKVVRPELMVYFSRVDWLPQEILSGDQRTFCFFPLHRPEETCGAHSVIGCGHVDDPEKNYQRPSGKVVNDFKVKYAAILFPIQQAFEIGSRQPMPSDVAVSL
jgi:hypothetical protein